MDINKYNHPRYQDGSVVDSYMKEHYHILRVQIACKMLKNEIKNSFPDLDNHQISILEIAGGGGTMSNLLVKAGYSVTFSDIEEAVVNSVSQKMSRCILDATKSFPFHDNMFHAIYAGDIIEHLFDTNHFLKECFRCLKNNGVLVLTTPNLACLQDRIRFLFGKAPRQVNPTHEFLCLHIRPFTFTLLKSILIKCNFVNIKVKTNLIRLKLFNKTFDFERIARLFPTLGRVLIVSAVTRKGKNDV